MFITPDAKKTALSPLLANSFLSQGLRSLLSSICSLQGSLLNCMRKNQKATKELAKRSLKIRQQKISENLVQYHLLQAKAATSAPSLAP